jgi:hypothetical protein
MARFAAWHGGEADILRLVQAIENNCTCSRARHDEQRRTPCAAHQMLAFDQRALDGLLFARWLAARLQDEEWDRTIPTPRRVDELVRVTRPVGPPLRRQSSLQELKRPVSTLPAP